jgi:hypothetical protein
LAESQREVQLLKRSNAALEAKVKNLEKKLAEAQNPASSSIGTGQHRVSSVTSQENPENVHMSELKPPTFQIVSPISQNIPRIVDTSIRYSSGAMVTEPQRRLDIGNPPLSSTSLHLTPRWSQNPTCNHMYSHPLRPQSQLSPPNPYEHTDSPFSSTSIQGFASPREDCCRCSQLTALDSRLKDLNCESEYYKSIVEDKWRNLRQKIKLLEEENGRLRSEGLTNY